MNRPAWLAFGLALAWYVGFWAKVCGALPGSWWLWCAPFYLTVGFGVWCRWEGWRERRRRRARAARFLRAVQHDFCRRNGLVSGRSEKPGHALTISFPPRRP